MSDEIDSHVRDIIRVVVKRATLLGELTDGATSKRDLRDRLDVSRSTVYKAVRELEETGLVEETGDGPRLTLFGRLFTDRYRSFAELAEELERYEPLLAILSPDAPVTTDVLSGADLTFAERHAPARPVRRIEELLVGADRATVLAPVALPRYVDLFYEAITTEGLRADIVFERPVLEYLRADYADRLGDAVETGRLSAFRTDATIPFGLIVVERADEGGNVGDADGGGDTNGASDAKVPADDEVAIIVYTEGGELRGIITNDGDAAVEWGRDVFDRYAADAEPISLD